MTMKEIKCLDCDETFKAETKEEALMIMRPHYMSNHKEMMENGSEESKDEWFERFNKEWASTEEINQ